MMPSQPLLLRQSPAPAPTPSQIVAERFRARSSELGMRRSDLMRETGMSRHRVNRLWTGQRILLPDYARVCRALDLDLVETIRFE